MPARHAPDGPDRLTAVPTMLHSGAALNVVPAVGELTCDIRADQLPTGQARLVELARALATEPSVLLLDEPASGLDDAESEAFADLLLELAHEGMGILMVEHDMDLVMAVCDTIRVLDFGEVIAIGEPAMIRSDPR